MRFSSSQVNAAGREGAFGGGSGVPGPRSRPMQLRWRGPRAITGRVVVMRRNDTWEGGGDERLVHSAYFMADRIVTVTDGETAEVDLPLAAVPTIKLIAHVAVSAGHLVTTLSESYTLPDGAIVYAGSRDYYKPRADFDLEAADLTKIAVKRCVRRTTDAASKSWRRSRASTRTPRPAARATRRLRRFDEVTAGRSR